MTPTQSEKLAADAIVDALFKAHLIGHSAFRAEAAAIVFQALRARATQTNGE